MAKLEAIDRSGANVDEIVALAAEHGFTFTSQEVEQTKAHAQAKTGELSEEDLDAVSGGGSVFTKNRYDKNVCPKLNRARSECSGFWDLYYCDHYSNEYAYKDDTHAYYTVKCAMGCFNYEVNQKLW
jgi:predicted ribosomally synthesized peptide with nif11-like leader